MTPSTIRSATRTRPADDQDRLVQQALDAGVQHHKAGELAAASALYAAVLDLDPAHAQALHLCGVIAHQQGAYELARLLCERAIHACPNFVEAHNTLGVVLQSAGEPSAAQQCFEAAVKLAPAYPDALQNLGALHAERGDRIGAIAFYRQALALGSRGPELPVMLAGALEAEDCPQEALAVLDDTLQRWPNHLPALMVRGGALRCLGRYDEACGTFETAIAVAPDSIEARIGLGTLYLDMLETDAAIHVFDDALALDPDHPQLRFNRALTCLTSGRLDEGWRDYRWRWDAPGCDSETRGFKVPRWNGHGTLANRTLLLWREQGIGDELLFASMLDDARRHTGHCIVECEPRLAPLLRRSFPDVEIVPAGHPPHPRTASPEIDLQAPLGDLAPLLRPTLSSFPPRARYLRADPERVAHYRNRLSALGPRPKVGICWRSSNLRGVRALACTSLDQWGSLLVRSPVDWINLQYDECENELAACHAKSGSRIHRLPELDMRNDLDATAALISALDLVITAPTTVSILSAGLGVPTWQLASGADWATLGSTQVPWLPSLRRFYRAWTADWASVLDAVSLELDKWVDARIAAGSSGLSGLASQAELLR